MNNLRVLAISYNLIDNIEDIFGENLQKLEVIDISNNKIFDLSSRICFFNNALQHINLENNNLTKLPTELGFMPQLKSLKIDGNQLKLIKRPIIEKGTAAIMDHLRNRHIGDTPVFN